MGWNEIKEVYKRFFALPTDHGDLLYQYRSLEGFWKIIEGDSFWATNARFSNDEEEQKLGIRLVEKAFDIEGKSDKDKEQKLFRDCYIVCFCEEDDKLSQWRGYAQNGVSIGFDFSNPRPYYVCCGDNDVMTYNMCLHVFYFNENTDEETIYNKLQLSKRVYYDDRELWRKRLIESVPFIKHDGFEEEKEYRLAFWGDGMETCIKYREGSNNGQIPYIVVKCGAVKKKKKTVVRIMFDTNEEPGKGWKMAIDKALKKERTTVIIECHRKAPMTRREKKYCNGCTKTRFENLKGNYSTKDWRDCPGEKGFEFKAANEIIISDSENQERVFRALYDELHKNGKQAAPKIWCEGHLPIRSITVGPNRDIKQVAESIRHYCQHSAYWLKDVEVKESSIPYRS